MAKFDMLNFDGEIEHETEKAWLFDCNEAEEPIWLPKSQCVWDEAEGVMQIPEWLCMEHGLI